MKLPKNDWKKTIVVFLWSSLLLVSVVHIVGSEMHWSRLVHAGETELRKVPEVNFPNDFEVNVRGGYDGSSYYLVAYDLIPEKALVGIIRYRRILYPFLSKLLSFGDVSRGMFLANILGLIVFAVGCWKLAKKHWILLCLLAQPAIWFSVQYGLTDLWGLSMLVWAFLYWLRNPICGAIFLFLSCLARETFLIFAVGIAIQCILKKEYRMALYPISVCVLWGGWSLLLKSVYSSDEMQGGIVFPCWGWFEFFQSGLDKKDVPQILMLVWLLASFFWCWRYRKDEWVIPIFLFAGATLCMKLAITEHFLAIGRVMNPLMFLLTLRAVEKKDSMSRILATGGFILFMLCAYRQFVVSEPPQWVLYSALK